VGPGLPAHAETEKGLVETARPEAAKVERHVDEAKLAEPLDDRLRSPVLPEARHLLAGDLQAGDFPVVADAELPEAERADGGLGPVDLAELLGGDGRAVREARGQAGHGRLVP